MSHKLYFCRTLSGCYKLFILGVLLLDHSNYFSVYCSAVRLAINSNKRECMHKQTHTHKHVSDIDMCFSILITYHVCAVGGISWMSMRMRETSWHLQHLQGQYLNQHYTSVGVYPSSLFLKEDPWHSLTICFSQSNTAPLNQWSHTNLPLIYSDGRGVSSCDVLRQIPWGPNSHSLEHSNVAFKSCT